MLVRLQADWERHIVLWIIISERFLFNVLEIKSGYIAVNKLHPVEATAYLLLGRNLYLLWIDDLIDLGNFV